MIDQRIIFARHLEQTKLAIQRSLDELVPKCRYRCEDRHRSASIRCGKPCLTLQRCDKLLTQTSELLQRQTEATP
jgi:hypothetical protein